MLPPDWCLPKTHTCVCVCVWGEYLYCDLEGGSHIVAGVCIIVDSGIHNEHTREQEKERLRKELLDARKDGEAKQATIQMLTNTIVGQRLEISKLGSEQARPQQPQVCADSCLSFCGRRVPRACDGAALVIWAIVFRL